MPFLAKGGLSLALGALRVGTPETMTLAALMNHDLGGSWARQHPKVFVCRLSQYSSLRVVLLELTL